MSCENMFLGTPVVGKVIKVRILVVDDDSTCLNSIAGMLKMFNYQVATTNDPIEAIAIIRENEGVFDIVLSDVHMPSMSGVELQMRVEQEFKIPVVLMTGDERERVIRQVGLKKDAYIIRKPPPLSDLQNLWHFVVSQKKGDAKSKGKEKVKRGKDKGKEKEKHQGETSGSHKRKSTPKTMENVGYDHPKKQKLTWTVSLHERFLEAIRVIGADKAVPKKILEYMNDPDLTRKHIASHLQKYRIYMKKIREANLDTVGGIPQNWNQRPFRSGFTWSQFPTLAHNSFLLNYANALNQGHYQQPRAPLGNYNNPNYHFGESSSSKQGLGSVLDPSGFTPPFASRGLTPHPTTFGAQNNAGSVLDPSGFTPPFATRGLTPQPTTFSAQKNAGDGGGGDAHDFAPFSILESSMVDAPEEDNGGSVGHAGVNVSGHVSNALRSSSFGTNVMMDVGSSSQPQRAYSNMVTPNMVVDSNAQAQVQPQLGCFDFGSGSDSSYGYGYGSGSSSGGIGNSNGMPNGGGFHHFTTNNMMNNFFMQPRQETSIMANNMFPYNYGGQIPNAPMGNMSNYVGQPQLGNMYNNFAGGAMNNNMRGFEPSIGMLNMFNFAPQPHPFMDPNVSNFVGQPPHFGNMSNNFAEPPQQLPTNALNIPSFVDQQPPPPPPSDVIVSNMSSLNISAGNYQQAMVPNSLNTTYSTVVANQEYSLSESDGLQEGSGYASGSENSGLQAMGTSNAENDVPMDNYVANLFLNNDPRFESNMEGPAKH